MAVTRIKNNQITNATINASSKVVSGSITGGLLADPLTYSGNLTVTGNLIVQGTTTTVDTTSTLINDPVIVLSRGENGTPSNDSGFLVKRGTSTNTAFVWDETNHEFVALYTTSDGITGGSLVQTAYANIRVSQIFTGTAAFGNISIGGNTISSTDTNGNVNIVPNGSGDIYLSSDTVVVGDSNLQANITTNGTGNLLIDTNNGTNSANIFIVQGTNGNIQLNTTGTGQVLVNSNITAPVFISNISTGTAPLVVTSTTQVANLNAATSGTAVTVTASSQPNITSLGNLIIANIDNIQINDNTISSTDINGNITLSPNGTGNIILNTATANRVFYSGDNKEILTSANFTFNGTDVAMGGDLAVNGGDITTTSTTFTVANANATTLNIGGAASAVNIGSASGTTIVKNNLDVDGTINMDGAAFTTTASTVSLMNANTATINFGGDATTVNIGSTTGTTTIKNNADVDGNINMDGGSFTTSAATVNIANASTTTLNIGGAATAVNIGATSGTTIVKNNLDVDGNINMDGNSITTSAATVNIANTTTTTLNIGGAATAVNIGATTGTTIVKNDLDVDGNINLDGGSLTTTASTVNIANANTTTLNVGGAATTVNIGSTSGTTVVNNDLQIVGNDIKSSTGNVAITLNNTDVTIAGNLTIQGITTNVGTNDLIVEDSLINLHTTANLVPLIADDGRDIGLVFHYYKSVDKQAALVWANDTGYLEYYLDATETLSHTMTGTYGSIKAATFVSNIATGTAPFIVNSTTQVANLNVASSGTAVTVTASSQPNITSLGNLTIANIDNIQINDNTISSTNLNGNINLTPDGTGEVIAATLTVSDLTSTRIVIAGLNGALTDSTNLTFNGTFLSVTGSANITSQANIGNIRINGDTISSTDTNGNVYITPNGTGDIYLTGDTVVLGDNNADTILTTNGSGNLLISTATGTNSGNINIVQGVNGNISLTPNGSGYVVIGNLAVKDNELISTAIDANIKISPNGLGDIILAGDTVVIGDTNTDAIVSTSGTGNLTISTNGGTNSGNIQLAQGTNGNITITPSGTGNVVIGNLAIANNNIISTVSNANITLTPNGSGDVVLSADTVTIGDNNADAKLTTQGTGNLALSTNGGVDSGTITIVDGVNGNIYLTPDGTGEVVASTLSVSDLTATRLVYAGSNGALVNNANLTFSGSVLTVTGNVNISNQANIGNINIIDNTISSIDSNGNINITANGTGYVVVNSTADSSDFIVNGNTTVSASYANIFYVKASTGQIGIGTNSPEANVRVDMSAFKDSIKVPMGLTTERPTGTEGMVRYNTATHNLEFYSDVAWVNVAGNFTTILANTYNGDGSTVIFTLPQDATSAGMIVSINGVVQIPGDAYGVSGTTLTFTEAPQIDDKIDVRLFTTTATVTQIADLTTAMTVNDVANLATIAIHGDTIVNVSNAAVYPGANGTIDLGKATTGRWKNVYATNTSIQNADLAEMYLADSPIPPGTVVSFGGLEEVTISDVDMDTRVAGVISTNPAHIMNSMLDGDWPVAVGLQGRLPCRVVGTVRKGDMMVSAGDGKARAEENPKYGSVIGKALEDFDGPEGIIEIVVGRV